MNIELYKATKEIIYDLEKEKYKIAKGETLLKYGDELIYLSFPQGYTIDFQQQILNKNIELLTDEMEIEINKMLYKNVIEELTLKTTQALTLILEIYNEYVVLPENLHNVLKNDLERIFKNSKKIISERKELAKNDNKNSKLSSNK